MYQLKKVKDSPVARDGIRYFIDFFTLAAILFLAGMIFETASVWRVLLGSVALLLLLASLFTLFFFRNPMRVSDAPPRAILSPADGKVMSITAMDEPDFIGGKAVKVSIFLSLFSVHINRSPLEGKVALHKYREGQMLPAFKSHASDINERNTIGIETADGTRILVHQITGFVARRIVWWVKPGDKLGRGERFGLIRFGSCTEIVMPADIEVQVTVGQKMRGGITIIGERNE